MTVFLDWPTAWMLYEFAIRDRDVATARHLRGYLQGRAAIGAADVPDDCWRKLGRYGRSGSPFGAETVISLDAVGRSRRDEEPEDGASLTD